MFDRLALNVLLAFAFAISLTPRGREKMARTGCDVIDLVDGLPALAGRVWPIR